MMKAYFNKALFLYLTIIAVAAGVLAVTDMRSIWASLEDLPFATVLFFLAQFFFLAHLSVFIWRIVLYFLYKPTAPCSDEALPDCTVIVPAFNEGRQAYDTIRSIARSHYPAEKMSIIGVDDGSGDDTWHWLSKAAEDFPGRVHLFRQPVNRGKRHALYRGFTHGKGEVFVTIDSDSTVGPETLRHLVSPFVRDHRVGAVAGNVRILNRSEGAIPKMMEVAFTFSFDFIRAGQSVINSVMCTPGALSAYRRSVVMKDLSRWVNQKFLGRPANIGEDRAMTNLILKNGYHVRYERDAIVQTTSPVTLAKLWKMLLRWARSNIRETLVISGFVFGKFREGGASGLRINVLVSWLNLTLGQMMRLFAVAAFFYLPLMVAPNLVFSAVVGACVAGIFYCLRYKSDAAVWALPYSFLWMTVLTWIGFYALLTPHKNGWMTRDLAGRDVAWDASPAANSSTLS